MWVIGLLAASAFIGIIWRQRRRPAPPPSESPAPTEVGPDVPTSVAGAPVDTAHLQSANRLMSTRLWSYCYGSNAPSKSTARMDELVRNNVIAILEVDALANNYFPRRPTLMSELMRALDDPGTASGKLSRMISHDPVLSADILRLANSSLYRVSDHAIETVQRAIAVCGVDALRGMLAAAMMRPVFKATSRNFPRLPRALWSRTERAARAAELYALAVRPELRFEAQMAVLVNALGPLVVHSVAVDVYSRNPIFIPNAALCVELTSELAPPLARRVAHDWQMSARLIEALEGAGDTGMLSNALQLGELFGTLAFLESQTVITADERTDALEDTGVPAELTGPIWGSLILPRAA